MKILMTQHELNILKHRKYNGFPVISWDRGSSKYVFNHIEVKRAFLCGYKMVSAVKIPIVITNDADIKGVAYLTLPEGVITS